MWGRSGERDKSFCPLYNRITDWRIQKKAFGWWGDRTKPYYSSNNRKRAISWEKEDSVDGRNIEFGNAQRKTDQWDQIKKSKRVPSERP